MPMSIPDHSSAAITKLAASADTFLDRSSTTRAPSALRSSNVAHPNTTLTLVSHHLCPYVQRAAIALREKGVPFERRWVNLADKPSWFSAVSPLGKVPLLLVAHGANSPSAIFESAVILEFLEETQSKPLHPSDPLARASERAWMAFGSVLLDAIAALYNAPDTAALDAWRERLVALLARLEDELNAREPAWIGPYFRGTAFGLVDTVFGPVFRYFDVFESVADLHLAVSCKHLSRWREALARRPSVRDSIDVGYAVRLESFLEARNSALGKRVRERRGFGPREAVQDPEYEHAEANAVIQWAR